LHFLQESTIIPNFKSVTRTGGSSCNVNIQFCAYSLTQILYQNIVIEHGIGTPKSHGD